MTDASLKADNEAELSEQLILSIRLTKVESMSFNFVELINTISASVFRKVRVIIRFNLKMVISLTALLLSFSFLFIVIIEYPLLRENLFNFFPFLSILRNCI